MFIHVQTHDKMTNPYYSAGVELRNLLLYGGHIDVPLYFYPLNCLVFDFRAQTSYLTLRPSLKYRIRRKYFIYLFALYNFFPSFSVTCKELCDIENGMVFLSVDFIKNPVL